MQIVKIILLGVQILSKKKLYEIPMTKVLQNKINVLVASIYLLFQICEGLDHLTFLLIFYETDLILVLI